MNNEKCFCHMNGYAVKDATARKQLQAYTTPEMFGAAGDGITDDTNAVQNAINENKHVVLAGKYKTTAPIVFPAGRYCILNGSVNYDGDDAALVLNGLNIKITGTGIVHSSGKSCLRVSGNKAIANCVVDIHRMYCNGTGNDVILLESSNADYCVVSNYFSNIILSNEDDTSDGKCNGVHIKTSANGYVNENTFDGLVYRNVYDAIKITNESTIFDVDGNRFLRSEGEDAERQICVEGTKGAIFNIFELRTNEVHATPGIIHVSTPWFRGNELRVNAGIEAACFDVSNGFYNRNSNTAELPTNRLFGNLMYDGATLSVNPSFEFSGDNVVFKHFGTLGGCSAYLPTTYTVNYAKAKTQFPNQEVYLFNVNDTEASSIVFDMNGKFAKCANFPIKIYLPWTTVGKAYFTLKDGDTVYIDAKEVETNNFYSVYVNYNGNYAMRKAEVQGVTASQLVALETRVASLETKVSAQS